VVVDEDAERDGLGGLERDADVVVVHGADALVGQIIRPRLVAATGGEDKGRGNGGGTGGRQHPSPVPSVHSRLL